MHITIPDLHPGRCQNTRHGERCLDYDAVPHVCSFPKPPPPASSGRTNNHFHSAPKPKRWVKPGDAERGQA